MKTKKHIETIGVKGLDSNYKLVKIFRVKLGNDTQWTEDIIKKARIMAKGISEIKYFVIPKKLMGKQ